MKVYVLIRHYRDENSVIFAVYKDKEKADTMCENLHHDFEVIEEELQ